MGAKSKAQCAIALQFAFRAFSGVVPEELDNLVRVATGIASDSVEKYKDANNSKSAKTMKHDEEETSCNGLIGATPDRYLRYYCRVSNIFQHRIDGCVVFQNFSPRLSRVIFSSFISSALKKEDIELAQEAWGLLGENFPKVAQEHLEAFITSLCNAGFSDRCCFDY